MPSPLHFAHFEVLTRSDGSPQIIGEGAMGLTYKAIDRNLLSLAVIKVPSAALLSHAPSRQRFLQEAQMMARLRHPHVASVFYYGESGSGPFYAMEFCDGPSLHDYIDDNGPLDPADAFRLALQSASALQALDAHDLVHRDLKPSNIILTTDSDGAAHAKLIDFGVAREGLPTDAGGLTLGGFVGTPAFASPEQLLEATHLDSRSDLYALGAVLWFCLTGSPPFSGSQFEVMFHHINTEPDWSRLPSMPPAHLGLLKRLLAKSAEERHASPAALVSALQALLGIANTSNSMQLRATVRPQNGTDGYDPIEDHLADDFGKVSRARDILTGGIVALRTFPKEFAAKQGLLLRLQRLSAVLRALEHPRWQRVLHFEHNASGCRLATEFVEGPTALQLLKARQQLPLADIVPLLAQVAEAMDYAATEGLTAMETAPERLPIAVAGWPSMSETQRSLLLRRPLAEWPAWSVKICPLRLSQAAQDYVLPSDSQAAQALTRLSTDFVHLCHRLLSGQPRATASYTPSPHLSAEANAFFEAHFNNPRSRPETCASLLRQLCLAEEIPAPEFTDAVVEDPYATRIVSIPQAPAAPPALASTDPDATVLGSHHVRSLLESDTFMAAFNATPASSAYDVTVRHPGPRPAAEHLQGDERLAAEREWLARERQALEDARLQVAALEQQRAERLSIEQQQLTEQKQALEQQQALLDQKRLEQQRLEQEIQLRAQLDFQKLQEEARSRESDLQRQRAAVEEALRAREQAFLQREKTNLQRLDTLKQEASLLKQEVEQEYRTLRQQEVLHSRHRQELEAVQELARGRLAREDRKLQALQHELTTLPKPAASAAQPPRQTVVPRALPPPAPSSKGKPSPLLPVLLSAVVLGSLAGGAYLLLSRPTTPTSASTTPSPLPPPPKPAEPEATLPPKKISPQEASAMLSDGVSQNHPDKIDQGLTLLKQAVAEEDADAMIILGEATLEGRGVEADAAAALELANRALARHHPKAPLLAARANLLLGRQTGEAEYFNLAASQLEPLAAAHQPDAAYLLFRASYNDVVKHPTRAVKALELGSVANDPACLYELGLLHILGQPPLKQDAERGRQLIQQSAALNYQPAVQWLRSSPL